MKIEISVQGEATSANFGDGVVTVGGGASDGVQIATLPAGFAELKIDGDRLMVKGADSFTVDEVLSPPGVMRLVLAGEKIGLAEGVFLHQVPDKSAAEKGTSAVLKQLLSDFEDPNEARCAHVTCLTGLDVGRRYAMAGDVTELGRGEDVHMRIRDRAVSRKHARIKRTKEGFVIEDLESPNGVFLNGRKVREPALLQDGAVIELGHSLLRFRAPKEEPKPAPEPAPAAPNASDPKNPAEAKTAGSPQADGASPALPARRFRLKSEIALIGLGVALALIGVAVTYGIASGTDAASAKTVAVSAPSPAPHAR